MQIQFLSYIWFPCKWWHYLEFAERHCSHNSLHLCLSLTLHLFHISCFFFLCLEQTHWRVILTNIFIFIFFYRLLLWKFSLLTGCYRLSQWKDGDWPETDQSDCAGELILRNKWYWCCYFCCCCLSILINQVIFGSLLIIMFMAHGLSCVIENCNFELCPQTFGPVFHAYHHWKHQ